ncbi:metallophosphoesterase [Gracilinema caldarium]|uniref:Metallophosphoesterase n=1 Tax=Gracilinema caldarium (strain ATCC 51460 / DSM 7334 / H1) TaxID=744872 RepID=F8EZE9_GRAC1|nr:metallophosphoesterase [Gracilinema caldarium]AEJ20172.1 metallophosphoesterase [Gracilinema caldarium DSM 7334]
MSFKDFYLSFQSMIKQAPQEPLKTTQRYVILSDLHMGDGGTRDDLKPNQTILETALEQYYLDNNFILILNGDIEDLNKFDLPSIQKAWPKLYSIFNRFAQVGRLRKIVGNHDLALIREKEYPYPLLHALNLVKDEIVISIFHGHQASKLFSSFDYISEFIVRYMAKPLHIKNASIAHHSKRRFSTERKIYRAARNMGIIAITGHTHRPLFESLSKYDSLRWSIEELLREYAVADLEHRTQIKALIDLYRSELERISKNGKKKEISHSLYSTDALLVPCLFNSGCATGKHGITAIELDGGNITLVHWTQKGKNRLYIEKEALYKDRCNGDIFKYTLKTDNLDQIGMRIALLSKRKEAESFTPLKV